MPLAKVNDINLYYEVHGAGHPLLLISGISADHLIWTPILASLARHFQVILIDNRGSGQSDTKDHPYTIAEMAQDATALLSFLSIKKTHILGHSMGGAITQEIAHKHPKLVDKLVIANSLIKLKETTLFGMRISLKMRTSGKLLPKQIVELSLPWLLSNEMLSSPKQVKQFIDIVLSNPHPQSTNGFKNQLEAISRFDSSHWFHKILAPTLIIDSAEDLCTPQDSKKLADGIPGAKYFCFEKMGHMPLIERPFEFATCVLDFLQ